MAKTLNPFTDVEYVAPQLQNGAEKFQSLKTLQVGYGSDVLRVSRQGIWLGRNTFEEARDAPTFAVGMDGVIYVSGVQASGVVIAGSTTLADWRHPSDQTTIAGGEIYTGSITASKITVSSLSALSANLGSVTAGTYQTAGSSTRIKIEDDDILWQRFSGSWLNCGVLRGASVSSFEYNDGSASGLSANGIEHYSASGTAFYSDDFSCEKIWVGTKVSTPLIVASEINLRNSSGGYVRLYKPYAGSNITVSNSSTTGRATISTSGYSGSHSWVNAEGDTVDITVSNGIITSFTVAP